MLLHRSDHRASHGNRSGSNSPTTIPRVVSFRIAAQCRRQRGHPRQFQALPHLQDGVIHQPPFINADPHPFPHLHMVTRKAKVGVPRGATGQIRPMDMIGSNLNPHQLDLQTANNMCQSTRTIMRRPPTFTTLDTTPVDRELTTHRRRSLLSPFTLVPRDILRYDPGDAFLRGWNAALAALADREREHPPSGFRETRDGVIREKWNITSARSPGSVTGSFKSVDVTLSAMFAILATPAIFETPVIHATITTLAIPAMVVSSTPA
ncbi:uncharacterized protein LOC62_06G007908 [Vanrija pseudolonga]|uniref:Uncharacterized protein n=1 Tax=Vanrija pseudolonga TaxID=143232 RepID=A0AAF0YCV4_9TREE|nr:hypothetical protein LOC62_06G007908 [Vanrija pseudolonga]